MAALEHHAHTALADLVEDDVVSDQEPAAFLLVHRGGLIGRQLPGLDQCARKPQNTVGRRRSQGFEFFGFDDAKIDE